MGRKGPDAGDLLAIHLGELGLKFEREFKFDAERKWRSDFRIKGGDGWHFLGVLVEIEGAVWTNGRHTRGMGFLRDIEKYNTASMLGYKILRFSTADVLTGKAKNFIKRWVV